MSASGPVFDDEYLYQVAAEAVNEGESKKALDVIEQVLSTNPKHAMAWHVKANCLDDLGRCEEALRSYDTAIRLDPCNSESWFNKGLTLKKMGLDKDSKICMDQAIRLALGE